MTGRIVLIVPAVVTALLVSSCSPKGPVHTNSSEKTTTSQSSRQEVVSLLKQMLADDDAWEKRNRYMSDRSLTQFMGAKHWYKKFPVTYAEERLITRGSSVVPILIDIATDRKNPDVNFAAWMVLAKFNDPRVLSAFGQQAAAGRLKPDELTSILPQVLPLWMRDGNYLGVDNERLAAWLQSELAKKTFDEIVLGLLDYVIMEPYERGGMYPRTTDERVLRWLDRIYDLDFDSWMKARAPRAFDFRQKQLAKGYDPIMCLNRAYQAMSDGLLNEAMVAMYDNPDDRKACQELLQVLYDELSPLHPELTDGWEKRLRDWYTSHRASLKYDPALLRFDDSDGDRQ